MARFNAACLLAVAWLSAVEAAVIGDRKLRHQGQAVLGVPQDCCPDVCADRSSQSQQQHKVLSECLAEGKRRHNANGTVTVGTMSLHREDTKCYRNPTVWGPPTWFFLHSMTLALDDEVPADKQESVKSIMYDLQNVLPCPSCGVNLAKHMKENPIEPHLKTRDALVKWMVDIHNMVNADVGKPKVSHEEAMRSFKRAFAKDGSEKYSAVIGHSVSAPGAQVSAVVAAAVTFVAAFPIGLF